MLFTVKVDPRYSGLTVYFFRRSGQTGQVQPLGTGKVNSGGYAFRDLKGLKHGQALFCYAKLVGATNISNPYSNDVAFHVN